MTDESDWKNVPAKKPPTKEELVEKAKKHIMKKAEEANDGPLDGTTKKK